MIHPSEKNCPQCGSPKMKFWDDLTEEQHMLVERLPMSADYPLHTRKQHRYCTRCWFEEIGIESHNA